FAASLKNPFERPEFLVGGGDDHLAADLVSDALFLTEPLHCPLTFAAVHGLLRAGGIVDAGMEHARIVTRLMLRDLRFLFKNAGSQLRTRLEQAICGGQPDNLSADNRYVKSLHTGGRGRT